jgi:hypothetical protein
MGMGGNDAFGRHCSQFSVGRGIGILTEKKDGVRMQCSSAICVTSLLLTGHVLRINNQQGEVHK